MRLVKLVFSLFWVMTLITSTNGKLYRKSLFTIFSPKIIQPGTKHNVTIFTEDLKENIIIRLEITCGFSNYSAEEKEISRGQTELIGVDIKDIPTETCSLNVRVKPKYSEWNSTDELYNQTKKLSTALKSISILIQVDKPIYKPGEIVKFRILLLNRQLRPAKTDSLEIKIFDSQSNLIKLYQNVSISKGLFSDDFTLSKELNFGEWKISASLQDEDEELPFSVVQYVLPKFRVQVNLPPYIINTTSNIVAEIRAVQSYGKEVIGHVTVQFRTLMPRNYPDSNVDNLTVKTNRSKDGSLFKGRVKLIEPPLQPKHPAKPTPKIIKQITVPINGSVFVNLEIPNEARIMTKVTEKIFYVEATVTENYTGIQEKVSENVQMYASPYKIEIVDTPKYYVPGFLLNFIFKITTLDGIPVSDDQPDAFEVSHGFSYDDADSIFQSSIPATGLVILSVITPSNENLLVKSMTASYKDVKKMFPVPEKVSSATKTYISVVIDGDHIRITCNRPMKSVNYLIVNQGQIVEAGRKDFSSEKKDACIATKLNKEKFNGPTNTIVAFAVVGANDEIVFDSTSYKVKTRLTNYLKIKVNESKVEAGENITISLETNPNSVVVLRGFDQSVLSLKDDSIIDFNRIEDVLGSFKERISRHKILGSWASRIFDEVGIVMFTNCYFEESSLNPTLVHPFKDTTHSTKISTHEALQSKLKLVRERFPESWMWDIIYAENSTVEIYKKVPKSMTSWVFRGYSLNQELGIGVNLKPQTLETIRPFFISFDLPYSVSVGSVFALKILLHNYMYLELSGVIIFKNAKKEFKFVEGARESEDIKTSLEKSFKILPLQVVSVTFAVKIFTIGEIKLEIEAKTFIAGDSLSKALKVVPQGIKQELNKAVLLDVRSETPVNISLPAMLPEEINPSEIKFSVVGDLFGTIISNSHNLFQPPFGCGEQNMFNFVPNIVILDYLKTSGGLTQSIEDSATNFLEMGYQRELTYRNSDGSFSVCGISDSSGSTWLTAFVVRSFIYARKYITIDQKTIKDGLEYLARLQKSNGMFKERGPLIRSDIQESVNSGITRTAYVVLSFLEARKLGPSSKYNFVVNNALKYLSDAIIDEEDPFTVVLICYTFHIAGHKKKDYAFEKVKKLARHDSQNQYTSWGVSNKNVGELIPIGLSNISHLEQPPISVEMTAYALMTYIMRNLDTECVPIVKWLLAQRNANGGFTSVVALWALSKFATMTKSAVNFQLLVSLNHSNGIQNFAISKENEMVVQEYILPTDTRDATVIASGKGMAMAQISCNFYITKNSGISPFNIKTEFKQSEEYPGKYMMHICSALAIAAGTESNMVVMEVNLPSGYILESGSLPKLLQSDKIMRFEEENEHTKLNIYFTSLTNSELCVDIEAFRLFNVGNNHSVGIIIYDYYNINWKTASFYQPPYFPLCKMCASVDQLCDEKFEC